MENATIISKLLFHWVTPLMEKGVKGLLNHSDDLFDLPDQISTNAISYKIDKHLNDMVSKYLETFYGLFNNITFV